MKSKILFAVGFAALAAVSFGQQIQDWDGWSWLVGAWMGEGADDPEKSAASEKAANAPIFRLIHERLDVRSVKVKFEISQDGEKYSTDLKEKSVKTEES